MTETKHVVCLTEHQLSTIIYVLEGYAQGNDDEHLVSEIDEIFEEIETTLDNSNSPETFIPNFHD